MTYQELVSNIRTGKKFDLSRWGDGEWAAVLGKGGQNCDGHKYFPQMGEALKKVLMSKPDYCLALQKLAQRRYGDEIDRMTEDYNIEWCCDSVLIHRQNINHGLDGLTDLFDACKDRDVMLVGPPHLYELAVKQNWYYVEIPRINCWLKHEEIHHNIKALIHIKDWVILYCASMMANWLIHEFAGVVTQVDIGSAFDPYVGIKSRTYHHNMI